MEEITNPDVIINSDSLPTTPNQATSSAGESSSLPGVALETELPTINFGPDATEQQICSSNSCSAGHVWQPVLALTKCPGCNSQLLVVKMVNCPICNEPSQLFRLRTDHLPQGGAVTPMCKGSASLGDVGVIEIVRQHAQHEQENHVIRNMPGKI